LHYVIGFADELHVAVFDAVVDHFHVMAGPTFADPVATGDIPFHLRRDALENILDVWPRRRRSAGHDAGAMPSAFLAAGDTGADVEQPFCFHILPATGRILVKRVTAIDDDVTFFQMRRHLLDEVIDRLTGLYEHHHPPRLLQLFHHLGN